MSKIINNLIEQKLYELMESSSFESLSNDEKEFVQNHFSKEEYITQREMMQELLEFEGEVTELDKKTTKPIPKPKVKERSKIKQLFTFKVPSYAVAASLTLALAIPQFINKQNQVEQKHLVQGYVDVKENVLIEKAKDSIRVEIEQALVKEEKAPNPVLLTDSFQIMKLKQSIETTLEQPKGRTAENDPYAIFYSSL